MGKWIDPPEYTNADRVTAALYGSHLVEIVKALAESEPTYTDDYWADRCPLCYADWRMSDKEPELQHKPECPYRRAVELLTEAGYAFQAEADHS